MYLKAAKLVANDALPSLKRTTIEEISDVFEVNGAAIEASISESDKPMSATFSALQSLAPSPHIAIISPVSF